MSTNSLGLLLLPITSPWRIKVTCMILRERTVLIQRCLSKKPSVVGDSASVQWMLFSYLSISFLESKYPHHLYFTLLMNYFHYFSPVTDRVHNIWCFIIIQFYHIYNLSFASIFTKNQYLELFPGFCYCKIASHKHISLISVSFAGVECVCGHLFRLYTLD